MIQFDFDDLEQVFDCVGPNRILCINFAMAYSYDFYEPLSKKKYRATFEMKLL